MRWTYKGRRRSIREEPGKPGWKGVGFSMGDRQEAYDAELAAIARGLLMLAERRDCGRHFTIFMDSQAAIRRAQNDAQGPGKGSTLKIIRLAEHLNEHGNTIAVRWVPAH